MRRSLAIACILSGTSTLASAQDPGTAELLSLVKSLQARVNMLERQVAARGVPAPQRVLRERGPVLVESAAPMIGIVPPRTVATWNGFYIGGTVGIGVPSSSQAIRGSGLTVGGATQTTLIAGQTTGTREPGVLAGARAGFNAQIGPNLIGGIQAELGLAAVPLNQRGVVNNFTTGGGAFFAATNSAFVQARLVWDAAITGKLGTSLTDRSMIYVLAGPAFGQMQDGGTNLAVGMYGATAGVGLEYRLSDNWSATGEYRYTYLQSGTFGASNFAATNQTFAPPAGQIGTTQSRLQASIHQLRFGVNRHFTLD